MKMYTLLDEFDAPYISLVEGHHSAEVFNEAFELDGWDVDPWPAEYISHEYWILEADGNWTCSNKNDIRSRPVTVVDWCGPREDTAKGPAPELH